MKIKCLRHALCYRHSDALRQNAGHPVLRPLMTDPRPTSDAARAIAAAALGRDPGPMTAAESISHHVYVGSDVVVKIIDAGRHSRLDREIALAPHLPAGLTAPLLASGVYRLGTHEVRYACYARAPGTAPGMGMPGTDSLTACLLAEEAVQRLGGLHSWTPAGQAEQTLREPLDHGGFVSQTALLAEVENLAARDRDGTVPRRHLDGLTAIAERAPLHARAAVPRSRRLPLGQLARMRPERDNAAGLRVGPLRRASRRLVLPGPVQRPAHGDRSRRHRPCHDDLPGNPPGTVRGPRSGPPRLRPPRGDRPSRHACTDGR